MVGATFDENLSETKSSQQLKCHGAGRNETQRWTESSLEMLSMQNQTVLQARFKA